MLLFDGPLDAVRSIGTVGVLDDHLHRRSPQWWWPNDRSWFVATEIDFPWTYLAGSHHLVDRIAAETSLETVVLQFDDRW